MLFLFKILFCLFFGVFAIGFGIILLLETLGFDTDRIMNNIESYFNETTENFEENLADTIDEIIEDIKEDPFDINDDFD